MKRLTFPELEQIINRYYPNIPPKSDFNKNALKMLQGDFNYFDFFKNLVNGLFDNIGTSLFDLNDGIVKAREASLARQQRRTASMQQPDDYYSDGTSYGVDDQGNLTPQARNNVRDMSSSDRRGFYNNVLRGISENRGFTYDPQTYNYYSDLAIRLANIKFELENRGVI